MTTPNLRKYDDDCELTAVGQIDADLIACIDSFGNFGFSSGKYTETEIRNFIEAQQLVGRAFTLVRKHVDTSFPDE